MTESTNLSEIILKKLQNLKNRSGPVWSSSSCELIQHYNSVYGAPGPTESFRNIGFTGSKLYKAVELVEKYVELGCNITLAYTSNAVTSGVREYLIEFCKNYPVSMVITTAGAVEEDLMKSHNSFGLISEHSDDLELRSDGINRSYNIKCPNNHYIWLADYLTDYIIDNCKQSTEFNYSEFCMTAGIDKPNTILGECSKKLIPTFVQAPLDGTLGDLLYFLSVNEIEIRVNTTLDYLKSCKIAVDESNKPKLLLILGGSIPKHHASNIHILAGGADSAIFFNTGLEYDGSNAGATTSELVSWGKIKNGDDSVKVYGDFTISFPVFYNLLRARATKYKQN